MAFTCAHYLPVGRARDLLETLTAIDVSTGFLAAIRGRAARQVEKKFLSHMRNLLATAAPFRPVVNSGLTVFPVQRFQHRNEHRRRGR
jgi:hypothetical protein